MTFMLYSLKSITLAVLSLLITFSLSACQWGSSQTDEEVIDGGSNSDSDVNINISTEAGDIFDSENSLHSFNLISFQQDVINEKNSRYSLYFDSLAQASSSVEPDEDEDQSSNDLTANQLNWWEEIYSESYSLNWLSISSPYNNPNSNYALLRPHQTLALSGDSIGQLNNTIYSRNYPLVEAIKDNIFEHHLGMTFIWDLDGLDPIKKEVNLSGDDFSDYESHEGFDLLSQASIWGESEKFSDGAKFYSGIKKINTERVVIESQLSSNSYSIEAASFDASGKALTDIPNDYDNAGTERLSYVYTLNFIDVHSLHFSFDVATQRAFYHVDSSSAAIASSSYTIDTSQNLLSLDTQNLTSLAANTTQANLLSQLQLTPFFNIAFVGPFTDENNAENFYFAKHFIASNDTNSILQTPYFFFNDIAYNDIQERFMAWRTELLDDAY